MATLKAEKVPRSTFYRISKSLSDAKPIMRERKGPKRAVSTPRNIARIKSLYGQNPSISEAEASRKLKNPDHPSDT